MRKLKKALLRYLLNTDPDLCAEVFTYELIGVNSHSTVDANALAFIRKNGGVMRRWCLYISNDLQQRRLMYGDKGSFYNGALFIVKILYAAALKAPVQEAGTPVQTEKTIINPFDGLSKFIEGMQKETIHGKEESGSEGSEGEITNV